MKFPTIFIFASTLSHDWKKFNYHSIYYLEENLTIKIGMSETKSIRSIYFHSYSRFQFHLSLIQEFLFTIPLNCNKSNIIQCSFPLPLLSIILLAHLFIHPCTFPIIIMLYWNKKYEIYFNVLIGCSKHIFSAIS